MYFFYIYIYFLESQKHIKDVDIQKPANFSTKKCEVLKFGG